MITKNEITLLYLKEKVGEIIVSLKQMAPSKVIIKGLNAIYQLINKELETYSAPRVFLAEINSLVLGKRILEKTGYNFLPGDEFLVSHFPLDKEIQLNYLGEISLPYRISSVQKSRKIVVSPSIAPEAYCFQVYFEPKTKNFLISYQ